jgi:hypothetical protein
MIKALSAIAVAAFVAAALTILPGFAPTVEASVPQPLAKGDRLDIRPAGRILRPHACAPPAPRAWFVRLAW